MISVSQNATRHPKHLPNLDFIAQQAGILSAGAIHSFTVAAWWSSMCEHVVQQPLVFQKPDSERQHDFIVIRRCECHKEAFAVFALEDLKVSIPT